MPVPTTAPSTALAISDSARWAVTRTYSYTRVWSSCNSHLLLIVSAPLSISMPYFILLSFCKHQFILICMSFCLSACLSVCVSVCLSVRCLSTSFLIFNRIIIIYWLIHSFSFQYPFFSINTCQYLHPFILTCLSICCSATQGTMDLTVLIHHAPALSVSTILFPFWE